jgi:hypothetical protein
MTVLPGGTVTLLFSDIEGSTRLLERLGDRYIDVLVAECLWGWAAVAAAQGEPARAACLWAAASVRDYALAVPPVAVRPLEAQLLSAVRQQLGWDAFRAEWARGQAMDLDDAIVHAVTS